MVRAATARGVSLPQSVERCPLNAVARVLPDPIVRRVSHDHLPLGRERLHVSRILQRAKGALDACQEAPLEVLISHRASPVAAHALCRAKVLEAHVIYHVCEDVRQVQHRARLSLGSRGSRGQCERGPVTATLIQAFAPSRVRLRKALGAERLRPPQVALCLGLAADASAQLARGASM